MKSKSKKTAGFSLWKTLPAALALAVIAGCASEGRSDAYGQFEGVPVTVSAETGGILQRFSVQEGEVLEAGVQVGRIDTVQAALRVAELEARLQASRRGIDNLEAETEVLREELAVAERDLERTESLYGRDAATGQELNTVRGRVSTLEKRIAAQQVRRQSLEAEISVAGIQLRQAREQLERTEIVNPVGGTVLAAFAEQHEMVGQGAPLYEIASLDTLILRAWVSGAQLPQVAIGQPVEVLVDSNRTANRRLQGRVSWIASEAEFTPRMIQTKEERVNQVYAVKVRVANPDGRIKIGMPGEINFNR